MCSVVTVPVTLLLAHLTFILLFSHCICVHHVVNVHILQMAVVTQCTPVVVSCLVKLLQITFDAAGSCVPGISPSETNWSSKIT